MASSDTKKSGKIGGIIFGLLFALPGLGIGTFSILPNLYEWLDMKAWVAVPAQLTHVELHSSRSDKSYTYRVSAQYHYHYLARDYQGHRVGIATSSDNIGEWHQDIYNRLRSAQTSQRSITVWVNPDTPTEAIIDRELRWGLLGFKLIFVVVFGGIGLLIIYFVLKKPRAETVEGVPLWQSHLDWKNNRILSDAKSQLWFYWIFAIFWCAVSSPALFAIPKEISKGEYLVLLAALFPLVGLFLIIVALRRTLAWRRFGYTPLTLDPFPGIIGGVVAGYVETRIPYRSGYKPKAGLRCVHVYQRRSGGKTETRERTIWHDTQDAKMEPGMRGSRIRFVFQTPYELPESAKHSRDYHKWMLDLELDLPGSDLDRRFEIPVFITRDSRTEQQGLANRAITEQHYNNQDQPTLDTSKLQIKERGRGLELDFPLFRNAGMGISFILFGAIFAAVAIGMAWFSKEIGFTAIFIVVFGFVGLGIIFSGLYTLGNSLHVRVNDQQIDRLRRVFGFSFRSTANPRDITALYHSLDMQSQGSSKTSSWYSIYAQTQQGNKIKLADSLGSASAANYVLQRIAQAARLPDSILRSKAQAKELRLDAIRSKSGHANPEAIQKLQSRIKLGIRIVKLVIFIVFAVFAYSYVKDFIH